MGLEAKFEELRKQSKEDFKFTMIAMDNVTGALNNVTNALHEVTKELGTVKAKMARQEERFELMLQAVQEEMKRVDPAVITDLVRRVEALEKKQPPAA